MYRVEVIIGSVLIGLGAGPVLLATVSFVTVGSMPQLPTFGPRGLTGNDGGPAGFSSRETVQFMQFWLMISFFLVGIGAWFLISGLKSKAIVSKKKH